MSHVDDDIVPFKWVVTEDEICDLYHRLDQTRWPHQLASPANDEWHYGTELGYLKELVHFWRHEYQITKHVAEFNHSLPQFTTTIRGRRMHFVHAVSSHDSDAPAVLLAHGWPGSVLEFAQVVEPLRQYFHVVAPSIPGYAWSEPAEHRGHTFVETARDYHILMLKLGYMKYFVHGGDWGAMIVKSLAILYPRNVLGLHTTMPIGIPAPSGIVDPPPTDDEVPGLARTAAFRATGTAYQQIQGSKPQTLAYSLTDSPVGLLAWILEKYRAWTDNDGDPATALSRETMITNVMIYWTSKCIGSSIRYYFENGTGPSSAPGRSLEGRVISTVKTTVPSAIATFPAELYHGTRATINRAYNVCRHTRFNKGGHFSGWEMPDELVADIRDFVFSQISHL